MAGPEGEPTHKHYDKTIYAVPAGQYVFTVRARLLPENLGTRNRVSANLEWDEATGEHITLKKKGGGVRIAKIRSAYGFDNPDKVTKYIYTKQEGDEEISSGSLLESDYIYEKWMDYVRPLQGPVNILIQKFVRFSQNRSALGTTQGSHVGYSQVTAVYGEDKENGRTVYTYTSPIDHPDFRFSDIPFPPARSRDYQRGLLKEQLDFRSGSAVSTRIITHRYNFNSDLITGLKVGWAIPGGGITGPDHLDRYAWAGYGNVLGYSRLIGTKVLLKDALGGHEKMVTYEYDEAGHKQLTKETTVDSEGNEIIAQYKYPTDYPRGTSEALDRMVNDHRLNSTVEEVIYKQESGSQVKVLSALKNDYALFEGTPRLAQVNSAQIESSLITTNPFQAVQALYEPRLVYQAYDDYGNILEHSQPHGMRTSYAWGENATLPIAKVEHAKANQIFYTSFEDVQGANTDDALTGKQSLIVSTHYTLPLSRLPEESGDYILSYWRKVGANPWSKEEKIISDYQPGDSITTNPIGGRLDEVRLYPVGAKMTTFTYQNLIGRATETDFNGLSTYYEYDTFGRLVTLRDHKKNILEHNEYSIGDEGSATTPPLNYVRSYLPQVEGIITQDQVRTTDPFEVSQSTDYYDGKARVIQSVTRQGSALGRDVVNIVAYDASGRRPVNYLPFTMNETNGDYKTLDPSNHPLMNFYQSDNDKVANTRNPYAITEYERSPLNRVIEQGAPGEAWQQWNEPSRTLKYEYQANQVNDAVLLWKPHNGGLRAGDTFAPGSLSVTILTDEHNQTYWKFKDKQERTIMELKADRT